MPVNHFNQPIGEVLPDFTPGDLPAITELSGQYVRIEPLSIEKHLKDAYQFYGHESPESQWTYLSIDAFQSFKDFQAYFEKMVTSKDPYYLAIIDQKSNKIVGTFSLMRINQKNRVLEMGWVLYSTELKQSTLATEAQLLVMQYVFETLHYRRYEWKCDSLNAPSAHAAERLGFTYEGTFRKAVVYKGRNRDTKWFSMLEEEYLAMKPKFINWLAPENFTEDGNQIKRLQDC